MTRLSPVHDISFCPCQLKKDVSRLKAECRSLQIDLKKARDQLAEEKKRKAPKKDTSCKKCRGTEDSLVRANERVKVLTEQLALANRLSLVQAPGQAPVQGSAPNVADLLSAKQPNYAGIAQILTAARPAPVAASAVESFSMNTIGQFHGMFAKKE